MSRHLRLPRTAGAAVSCLCLGLAAGCGPSPDAPLPPTDDPFAHSVAVAERARRLVPGEPARGLFHLAGVHERFGKEDQALELYHEAVAVDANLGEAYRRIGFILSQRKDRMVEAISAYQQSLRCEPNLPGVLTRIGLVLTHLGKQAEAITALEDEIRAGTANDETHYNLGQAQALQGKHEEAVKSFQAAIARAPESRSAHYSLAQSLRALGRKDDADLAQRRFQEIKAREDAAEAAVPGDDSGRRKSLRNMAETWLEAASLFAIGANATREPGARARLEKEHAAAIAEATRIDPTHGEAYVLQAAYLRARGDLLAAARACESGLTRADDRGELVRKAYEVAGDLLTRMGDGPGARPAQEQALVLLRRVVAESPNFAEAHLEIAKAVLFRLRGQGDWLQLALTHAGKAVELGSGPRGYDILAYAYHQAGRLDLGLATLESGIAKHPDDAQLKDRLEKLKGMMR